MASLPPNPAQFRDVTEWARQFYEFYLSQTRFREDNDPLPVLLPHRANNVTERATTAGVVLYDPSFKTPVYSVDGQWRPFGMDSRLFIAELEIASTFGDTVSIAQKAKTLLKFGNNADLDTADGFATVWQLAKEAGTENEVYPATGTNPIDSISSTNAADTMSMTIEGHISDGNTGVDENFTFATETVTLNGQNRVALANSYARISRLAATDIAGPAGDVYVYENTALTAGKPTDITKAHISVEGSNGETQSFKAATTFSSQDYFVMTNAVFTIRRNSGTPKADFRIEVRRVGGVFRPVASVFTLDTADSFEVSFDPAVIVPKNADIRVIASTTANNTAVSADFQGYLAGIVQ